ncbi:MAG: YybH family protein [Frankiaceae bacterium]
MSQGDVDALIEAYHQALGRFLKGEPEQVARLYSRREDVTLANPLGPPRLGRADVETALAEASANFQDGTVRFEPVSKCVTADLAYLVQLERYEMRLRGSEDPTPISQSLRVTMIFRREGDGWKVSHRHADTVTTPRSFSSLIEQ